MQKLINFLRGSIRLEVTGAFPERFLNLCAQHRVPFWGVEWLGEGTVRLTVAGRSSRKLEAVAEKVMCQLREVETGGLPSFLGRFRRRYALLIGLFCALTAVCVLSQFILTVDVSGNERVPTAQILAELRRQGLRVGTYGPGLDSSLVAQQALIQLEDLAWMSVNVHGTRAEVLVRERIAGLEPVEERLGNVVAKAPGIITHLDVLEGEPLFQEGDTVEEGDVVISGNMSLPVPQYSELQPGLRQVSAKGRIYARTWRTLAASIPLEASVKVYTGEEETRLNLLLLGGRINFYGNSSISFPQYDKISSTWTLSLPGGQTMPLALARETVRAYTTTPSPIDQQAAQTLLEERLADALRQSLGEGEVITTHYTAAIRDNMLTVTLQAECKEEIGKFVPFTGEP
ncbi:MAG: sporulation protein YqfD [Oscillospiraceae bacterium]|nr:sporulation protein YqfD [Oscillospiraceae bacterium]